MLAHINGYLVVASAVSSAKGQYGGVDRAPWATVGDGFYQRCLPEDVRLVYDAIRPARARGFWWPTCTALHEAERLLKYTQSRGQEAELIGVFSPYLQRELKRTSWEQPTVQHLGFDVIAVGEWSLARALMTTDAAVPSEVLTLLNQHGLLDSADHCTLICEIYREMAKTGAVEKLARAGELPIEAVNVWKILPTEHT